MSDPTSSIPRFRMVVTASLGLVAILLASAPAFAAVAPPLGAAQSFAVLGATPNVNNTGPTVVTGDLGVSPAAAVIGFPPGTVIGTIHAADATAASAQSANTTAYGVLAGEACNTSFGVPTDLAGMTLAPGVYCFASSAANTGLLQLDAMGNANAVWVFQIASTLITGSASTVSVINGGQACNVFWQVGSSATLGTTTTFVGNILALASVTLQTGASLSGRALAQTGTVTLASNSVSVCSLAGSTAPTTLTTQASPAVELGGLDSRYRHPQRRSGPHRLDHVRVVRTQRRRLYRHTRLHFNRDSGRQRQLRFRQLHAFIGGYLSMDCIL